MDRVRFGRALGMGARQAVKTLVTAVDAATAPDPNTKAQAAGGGAAQAPQTPRRDTPPAPQPVVTKAAHTVAQTVAQARQTQQGFREGRRRFKEAAWGPVVRLSGVVGLEVVGVLFGVFALFAMGAAWRLRGEWHWRAQNPGGHGQLLGALAMLAIFGYFCVSSFVRARRRERRR